MESLKDPFAQPPRRGRRWPWIIFGVLFAGFLIAAVNIGIGLRAPASSDPAEVDVVITAGQGSTEIGYALAAAGGVKNPWLFIGYSYVSGQGSRLQPGSYRLPKNLTVRQLANRLSQISQSRRRSGRQITIPEG